jgi:ATP-dependent RNA helicase RhlE
MTIHMLRISVRIELVLGYLGWIKRAFEVGQPFVVRDEQVVDLAQLDLQQLGGLLTAERPISHSAQARKCTPRAWQHRANIFTPHKRVGHQANRTARMDFSSFGIAEGLIEGLEAMGIRTPTPIQAQAIPVALDGKDLIACAQTGTGKTAAYLVPMVDSIVSTAATHKGMRALVVVPTRELALQIDQQLQGLAYFTPITCFAVYGGSDAASFDQQKAALTTGTDIIIATPGKLLSHLNLGYVPTKDLEFLVLDEADRMLDMGFQEDIMRILSFLPKERQNLMFSATMPPRIRDMARRVLKDPVEITLALSKPAEGVDQRAYVVHRPQKAPLLEHVLRESDGRSIIVFVGTKHGTRDLARHLKRQGFDAAAMHSDLEQSEREEVLLAFRNRRLRILVATNVVSRGIDIEDIDLVVNWDVPSDPEDYVHRVGRTARAERTGVAVTFIDSMEMAQFGTIERLIDRVVTKMPVPERLGPVPEYLPERTRRRGEQHGGGGRRRQRR